jgi:hypothetical protein
MLVLMLVVALAWLAWAPPVAAQPKTPAARAFAKARQLFKERNYVEAIKEFDKAYRLRPHFFVQCSIARCHENLNDFIKAAEHYKRCLDEGAAKSPKVGRVRDSLEAVEKKIAWLTVRSPGGGGTIYVDGREAGRAPGKIPLNPGSHVVEVRREGATSASATVESSSGGAMTVTLSPKEIAPEVKPPVASEPRVITKTAEPPRRRGLHQAWFWTAAATTVVLATTFIVLGAQTVGLRSDYLDQPSKEGYDQAVERRALTNVFLGLAGAAAATTTVLFFFTDFGGKESESRGREAASFGLGLRGTF